MNRLFRFALGASLSLVLSISTVTAGSSLLNLGPEEFVQANGAAITVLGYSVPSFVDWNNDGLNDLVIGEGGGTTPGKIRIYINVGTQSNPQFTNYSYASTESGPISCAPQGCMGCFPRVVYWDDDNRKDLLVGMSDGTIQVFLNAGTDENPIFKNGELLKVGFDELTLDVGSRATPTFVDFNNDGMTDLIVGGLDGAIHIYYNCGCGGFIPPHFYYSPVEGAFAKQDTANLSVPTARSSPVIMDLDGDGKKDLLTGNTEGQLLLYKNVNTDKDPNFTGYSLVESNGVPIDLAGTPRSRPFVCHWTGKTDGYLDVLIGSGDGRVRLYRGKPMPGDLDEDGDIDSADLDLFTLCWLKQAADACTGRDLNADSHVDFLDFQAFANAWLTGAE